MKILDLPVTDAGCGDIHISSDGVDLTITFETGVSSGMLTFESLNAFRFRDEMHSFGFVRKSIDSVVEVIESEWLKQILTIEPHSIGLTAKKSKHFAVMLSNNGYLEVIARSLSVKGLE